MIRTPPFTFSNLEKKKSILDRLLDLYIYFQCLMFLRAATLIFIFIKQESFIFNFFKSFRNLLIFLLSTDRKVSFARRVSRLNFTSIIDNIPQMVKEDIKIFKHKKTVGFDDYIIIFRKKPLSVRAQVRIQV